VLSPRSNNAIGAVLFVLMFLTGCSDRPGLPKEVADAFRVAENGSQQPSPTTLDDIKGDHSRCLQIPAGSADREEDLAGSCLCRDAVADARYVMFAYLVHSEREDQNLSSALVHLNHETIPLWCGQHYDATPALTNANWKWNGPDARLADANP
jgi:hypothetical protein